MDTRDKQKYVEVPAFVEGYHEPEPPKTRSWDIFSVDDYKDLDERVKHIPKDKQCDFPTLVRHLTDGLTTDVQKVRAIFSWMGEQNHQDVKYHKKTYRYSPNGYLKHMKETMSSKLYSTLFAILCREAGLQCVNLTGICKAGNYEVGDADISQNISHWNAVYIEGSWRFVHCFWAFTTLFGSNTGAG